MNIFHKTWIICHALGISLCCFIRAIARHQRGESLRASIIAELKKAQRGIAQNADIELLGLLELEAERKKLIQAIRDRKDACTAQMDLVRGEFMKDAALAVIRLEAIQIRKKEIEKTAKGD